MKTIIKYFTASLFLLTIACQSGQNDLDKKKEELSRRKKELQELKTQIATLEKEIKELDPEFGKDADRSVLVSTVTPEKGKFEHKVHVRGAVESRKNVLISAEVGGKIEQINVKEGQRVSKGQVLLRLDSDIIQNSIAELKTSLELATVVYERQANLWKNKIGTEIQYLEAKNNKESLERKLATANSQLNQTILKAPFSGVIDDVIALQGETATPGHPLIRIVNPNDVYIKADVSEAHIGKFKAGDPVSVHFPSLDQDVNSSVSSVSQVINTDNRTFVVEVKLASLDFKPKPNQVTVLFLTDYVNEEALTVPANLVQKDDIGDFVFCVEKNGEGSNAKKRHIKVGVSYDGRTEVVEGLTGNEAIVDKGFRELTEGAAIRIADNAS
ncbi:efflux RND transporter periplasmic adaptor subunit [Fulvivirgaceae bacterium BMA10]|uniref:Efflux RND transporter periplasmic adaptor subunit n=1 Tax=Splendidivirga corallicola TaxID=3051826 RepID=A0ABT8KPD3_9BACT|nr:efflux RND transporter periplasmic adaptor subunit [Fulvivirgaceae bacterium BMA10]